MALANNQENMKTVKVKALIAFTVVYDDEDENPPIIDLGGGDGGMM